MSLSTGVTPKQKRNRKIHFEGLECASFEEHFVFVLIFAHLLLHHFELQLTATEQPAILRLSFDSITQELK